MTPQGTGYGAPASGGSTSEYGTSRDSAIEYGTSWDSAIEYGTSRDSAIEYGTSRDSAISYGSSRGGAPVVSFDNVSKRYGNLQAVDGLTLELRHGETVALLGPNGAGKSTSLDMLLALRKPSAGRITMFGSDPYHAVKSGRVGAMLQSGGLMPEVTVRELVTLITKVHPNPEPVAVTLKRAGAAQFADQRVDRLSGGQTQRVRFALAICGKSELIVLDEPTTAMDVETRRDPGHQPGPAAGGRHASRDQVAGRGQAGLVPAGPGGRAVPARPARPGEPRGQARRRADPVQRFRRHLVRGA
jgi:ABC-type lipoprotein export system ATPase subunit